MIRRRAAAAGIAAPIGSHTFRATGITPTSATAARSITPSKWRRMTARARKERLTQDEVERIRL
jgi:hypothetical protein